MRRGIFHAYSSPLKQGNIETFCRAPHGTTVGYTYKGMEIIPILEKTDRKIWEECGLFDYIDGVCCMVEEYYDFCRDNNLKLNGRLTSIFLAKYSVTSPDEELAGYIGDFSQGEQSDNEKYAPKITRNQIKEIFMDRTCEPLEKYYTGSSIAYSLMRATKEEQEYALECEKLYWEKGRHQIKESDAKKIVIYAAGFAGREFYHRLLMRKDIKIVAWVDMEADSYRKRGYPVEDVSVIKHMEFDELIIAIVDEKMTNEVKNILGLMGMDMQKIVTYKNALKILDNENG